MRLTLPPPPRAATGGGSGSGNGHCVAADAITSARGQGSGQGRPSWATASRQRPHVHCAVFPSLPIRKLGQSGGLAQAGLNPIPAVGPPVCFGHHCLWGEALEGARLCTSAGASAGQSQTSWPQRAPAVSGRLCLPPACLKGSLTFQRDPFLGGHRAGWGRRHVVHLNPVSECLGSSPASSS